ncbi:MAG TPA: hypothetical protein PKI14_11280 [Fervidobacterium sp.]|nr:hypothetical protein [Fervidobacterium sp.]HQE49548.1 hypothetical protein [Fervidobacterium sp.]HUM43518.1 hypothetical protein [Fervidobacterium sp.]
MSHLFETKQYVFHLSDVVCIERIYDSSNTLSKVYVKMVGDVKIMLEGKDARDLVEEYMEMWDNEV